MCMLLSVCEQAVVREDASVFLLTPLRQGLLLKSSCLDSWIPVSNARVPVFTGVPRVLIQVLVFA